MWDCHTASTPCRFWARSVVSCVRPCYLPYLVTFTRRQHGQQSLRAVYLCVCVWGGGVPVRVCVCVCVWCVCGVCVCVWCVCGVWCSVLELARVLCVRQCECDSVCRRTGGGGRGGGGGWTHDESKYTTDVSMHWSVPDHINAETFNNLSTYIATPPPTPPPPHTRFFVLFLFFCWRSKSSKFATNNSNKTRRVIYSGQQSLHQRK